MGALEPGNLVLRMRRKRSGPHDMQASLAYHNADSKFRRRPFLQIFVDVLPSGTGFHAHDVNRGMLSQIPPVRQQGVGSACQGGITAQELALTHITKHQRIQKPNTVEASCLST